MSHVAIVVGSLRRESFSRLAHALLPVAPASMTRAEVAIGDLALFNEDFERTAVHG